MIRLMRSSLVASLGLCGALCLWAAAAAGAQSAAAKGTWTVPRTPDGQPDLRGTWVNFDSTPFETAGAAAAAPPAAAPAAPGINPPSHWADHDSPMKAARPSMVIDPPDGKVPVMKWAEDKRAYDLDHVADNWVHQTPWERCITRGIPAGMFPAGYNNVISSCRRRATWSSFTR